MSARVGINGFGRMGRLALRAAWGWPELTFTHVNELHGDAGTAAHLLTFDSIHGRWSEDVHGDREVLTVNGTALGYSSHPEPGDVPWGELGVEVVLECSGRFRTPELLDAYFRQGVRKVIVAAPVKDGALNVVVGVNDHLYDPERHDLLTAASCTTNCLAPVVKVIHEGIGIRHGQITTLHDMTNTQTLIDSPAQGPAPGTRSERLADPHHDRVGDRDRAHLPGARGQAERPRRAGAAAQRLAHGLRVRGRPADDGRGGQRPARSRRGGPAGGDPRIRATAAGLGRLQGRPALGDRRRPLDHGHRRDAGEDPRLVRQRVGLRKPPR